MSLRFKKLFDVIGLPQGEAAFASGNDEFGGHSGGV